MREHLLFQALSGPSLAECGSAAWLAQAQHPNVLQAGKSHEPCSSRPCGAPSARMSWHGAAVVAQTGHAHFRPQPLQKEPLDAGGGFGRAVQLIMEGVWEWEGSPWSHLSRPAVFHQGSAPGGIQSSDAFFLMAAKVLLPFNSRQITWKIQPPTGGNSCGSSCWGRSPAGH